MKTKRLILSGLFYLLMLASFLCSAEAIMIRPTLEVTGIFDRIEELEGREMPLLVLIVDGEEASGPIRIECLFIDEKGNNISRDDFVRLYIKRIITAEILEDSGEVVLCRVGS